MRLPLALAVLLGGVSAFAEMPAQRPRLYVNELVAQGVTPAQALAFTDAVVAALSERQVFDVVSTKDAQVLLGAERQRALLGICETAPEACARDATSLLAARFVLAGQLSRVGSAFQLSLQMVDTERGAPVARSTRLSGTFEELRALVPYAAAEATGSPLPPPPSRVLPVTLMAAGGATLFAGGVVGLLALSRQGQLNDELCPGGVPTDGRCSGLSLRDRSFYVAQDSALTQQKWLAVGLMVAGAAVLGVGWWLLPPNDARSASAALLPSGNGVAFAGSF